MINFVLEIINKLKTVCSKSNGKCEDDIIKDSYYLISLFKNDNNRPITALHIQKIMYLFEAYYMNSENVNMLYESEYRSYILGPNTEKLYRRYCIYWSNNIELSEEDERIGQSICNNKKDLLNEIYEVFKNFSVTQLINFTSADDSPCGKAWKHQKYSVISKKDIKKWFKKYCY